MAGEPRSGISGFGGTDLDPADVPIRPAATVMLIRDVAGEESGIEVFMLRRTTRAAFGAGMFVFPGGRVDEVDALSDIAQYCRGLDDRQASDALGVESGGLAFWVAAVRECFEEAGVLLAERSDGQPLALDPSDRHAIHDATMTLVELCERNGLLLDLSATHYVDHWITPVGEPRRFDTRFFLAQCPADQVLGHDDRETVASLWVRPADAMRMADAGELTMMPPTIANLGRLVGHPSVAAALSAAATMDRPAVIEPRLRLAADGSVVGVAMPGDADYRDL
jgi:8-oxo-dGTP pyrophosphatase MutT (NUDIX family)